MDRGRGRGREKKASINTAGTTKISFGVRARLEDPLSASRYTQGGHYNVCTLARAGAHTAVSTAHMHNSGATNASSHIGERNIKKRAEHKATGRRGREEERTRGRGRRKRWWRDGEDRPGGNEIGRQKKRDAAGIKGEA